MKTHKTKSLLLLIALLQFSLLGCAEKKEINSDGGDTTNVTEVPPEVVTTNTGYVPDDSTWGYPVPMAITSNFQDFTGRQGDPDFNSTKLYYDIQKVGSNYTANIRLYYKYTEVTTRPGEPSTTTVEHKAPKFESGGTATDIQFNKYHYDNGQAYWIAFVEEKRWNGSSYVDFRNFNEFENGGAGVRFGSLMIILDDLAEDGYKGSVYYRNFAYSDCIYGWGCPDKPQAEHENYKCWNIRAGPYSCREFVQGGNDNVNGTMLDGNQSHYNLDYPTSYKKLGTVSGIFIP